MSQLQHQYSHQTLTNAENTHAAHLLWAFYTQHKRHVKSNSTSKILQPHDYVCGNKA